VNQPVSSADEAAERLLTLDALRGVAATAVLLLHIGFLSGERWLAPLGFLAVDLFFMISGFVIGFAFEPKLLAGMKRRRFMALRIARLYPMLLMGLLLGGAAHLMLPANGYTIGWHSLGHFLLLPDLGGPSLFPLNGVLWTLFFELAINAAHAMVARWLTTARLALFVLASGLIWYFAATTLGDWGAGWNSGTFFTGGFARVAWGYGSGLLLYRLMRAAPAPLPAVSFLVPLAAAALLLAVPRQMPLRIAASVFLFFPFIVLLGAAARVPDAARPAVRWLSALSYPLYAIHLPCLTVALWLGGGRLDLPYWLASGAICILFATALAFGYDIPVRRRLRRMLVPGTARPLDITGEPNAI
jgi:peptidoglycan/LPS O-acetylase OafA/YrhL